MATAWIGVTTCRNSSEGGYPIFTLAEAYINALQQAGAMPVMIPLGLPEEQVSGLLSRVDGVLFSGGGDVLPERYGSAPHPRVDLVDEDRDRVSYSSLSPVGIFDSGVGGLSVLRAIRQQLPGESLLYLADQAHVPYGPRPLDEVRSFSNAIARFLLSQGAKLIVVACNAASAAALHSLRQTFPDVPFVGMEPAVKPAAERTQSGVVGVLATPATFQGALYASVVERFAQDVTLFQHTCPGLVAQIEVGNLDASETRRILEEALHPMLAQGIDTVVLGCTHYPFVIPMIQDIVGPQVRVIDPAPAVARQVGRVLEARGLRNPSEQPGESVYFTSGDPAQLRNLLPRLIGVSAEVHRLRWAGDRLHLSLTAT